MAYNFGEKTKEYHAKYNEELPVWKSPKYEEAKRKAIEIIESGKYNICEADFWILMNATKNKKMMYTGLIISHNGCLKINDCLESRFNPDCVSFDKEGYNGSLVFTYCNAEQGIYEIGEVSKANCSNDYPYAMAYKRLFDRVVLKLSKLAYSGIYSDSESDEFIQRLDGEEKPDKLHIDALLATAASKGVTEAQLCKRYNVKKLTDMDYTQYCECAAGLQKMKDIAQ